MPHAHTGSYGPENEKDAFQQHQDDEDNAMQKERFGEATERPLLMCEICHATFYGEDDVTFCCDVCDRCGFCEDCADPFRHDCKDD